MLLRGSDNGRYYQFKMDLSNDMTKGTDNYPKTMVETMRMLTDYVLPPRLQCVHDPEGKGLAFVQGEGGASRGPKKDIKCFHCNGPHRTTSSRIFCEYLTSKMDQSSASWGGAACKTNGHEPSSRHHRYPR
jgi:hypothetical protein